MSNPLNLFSMKRFLVALVSVFCLCPLFAQGLRHSVSIVAPEYSADQKRLMEDYSLFMARAGMRSASQVLRAYKSDDVFGSGVLIALNGRKYVLTNLHVVGYASQATIHFQLHEKNVRYEHCPVVALGTSADLALVELPADCDMIPLELYTDEPTEEMAVVAAGFPGLGDKPSWQLTRGYISNARLEAEQIPGVHVIQHTASIDPGSSGGPLLFKVDDKYRILGINTWKAFYREGVGLAIGAEDIRDFLASLPESNAAQQLASLQSLSGEDWLYALHKLPEADQKNIKSMDWHLPLDQALQVLAVRDSLVENAPKSAKKYQKSATHIVTDKESMYDVRLFYDNYLGMNMQPGLQVGYDLWRFMTFGTQFSVLLVNSMTEDPTFGTKKGYKLRPAYMFGLFFGGQLPISVGRHILAPRIVQSAAVGPQPTGNIYGGFAIMTDTRVGLDWRIPFSSSELILGLHYDMNWIWSKNDLQMTPYKKAANSDQFNQYLQHGVGLSLGIAW